MYNHSQVGRLTDLMSIRWFMAGRQTSHHEVSLNSSPWAVPVTCGQSEGHPTEYVKACPRQSDRLVAAPSVVTSTKRRCSQILSPRKSASLVLVTSSAFVVLAYSGCKLAWITSLITTIYVVYKYDCRPVW